jgi:hypothetical protein
VLVGKCKIVPEEQNCFAWKARLPVDLGDSGSMIQKTTSMKLIPFLTKEKTRFIRQQFGTPVFVYDQRTLQQQAGLVLDFPNAYGPLCGEGLPDKRSA